MYHWSWFPVSELSSVDDDWEKDFDIEVSEEDIRLAQEAARKLAENKATVDDVRLFNIYWTSLSSGYSGSVNIS